VDKQEEVFLNFQKRQFEFYAIQTKDAKITLLTVLKERLVLLTKHIMLTIEFYHFIIKRVV
jgi:hypothetical protein